MFRELTIVAVVAAVVAVVILRLGLGRSAGRAAGAGAVSRFPLLEGLAAWVCALTFLGLTATGFYDIIVHNQVMHSYTLMVHMALAGAFTAALAGLAFLRAEANGPGAPGLFLRKASFWLFVAMGLALILTAALAMIPWLGTTGQSRIIDLHRWAAVLSVVAAIGYVGLRFRQGRQPAGAGTSRATGPAAAGTGSPVQGLGARPSRPAADGSGRSSGSGSGTGPGGRRRQGHSRKKSGRKDRRPASAAG